MLRLTVFLKRNPDLTVEEFRSHWRDVHGPLIRDNPDLARHIVRYEQHLPADVGLFAGTEGYDGIAVQWLESIDAFKGFMDEPAYMTDVYPDEERFLDRDGLVWMVTDEPTVVIAGDP
jgi:uncharacterized protein (TIGR02118 family)